MKRTAFIHIGVPKTGTKSVQSFLQCNKGRLLDLGILFPGEGQWHAELASYFADSVPGFAHNRYFGRGDLEANRASDANYFHTLKNEIESSDWNAMVLSYEAFYELSKPQLEKLNAFLRCYCEAVKVVFFVRDAVPWAASAYSTHAYHGFPNGLNTTMGGYIFPYRSLLPRFTDVFGKENCIGFSYDEERKANGDILKSFLKSMGVVDGSLSPWKGAACAQPLGDGSIREAFEFPKGYMNSSMSWETIVLAKELRRLMGSDYETFGFRKYHQIIALIGYHGKTSFELTQAEKQEVLDAFAPHQKYLQETFGLSAVSKTALADDPKEPTSLDLSVLARVAAALFD